MDDQRRLVYSTDGGWHVTAANEAAKRRRRQPAHAADDGVVRVARERRTASVVTTVTGVSAADLDAVAKALKRLCGAGGTVKTGRIEIQGDHRDRIVAYFEERGVRAKRAGG